MVYSWQFYHEYELKHQHNSGQAQNEAREILLPLPNGLASKLKGATTEKQKEKLKKICDALAKEIIGENHDYEYAVHWNHSRTNLHCHLMFSEREVMDASKLEQKTYAKDIWQDPITHKLTKKGTGELVHKKGDLMFKNGQPVYKQSPYRRRTRATKKRVLWCSGTWLIKKSCPIMGMSSISTITDLRIYRRKNCTRGLLPTI